MGQGYYQTTINLNISKIVWWIENHPMNLKLSLHYNIPSSVSIKNFNAFGGGYGASGRVRPGQNFSGNIGYEVSLTEHWVFALDIIYLYNFKSTFDGNNGLDSNGNKATNSFPFYDLFSLAPAIEYNFNPNLGLVAGVWFPVWGRNCLNFISGAVAISYTF